MALAERGPDPLDFDQLIHAGGSGQQCAFERCVGGHRIGGLAFATSQPPGLELLELTLLSRVESDLLPHARCTAATALSPGACASRARTTGSASHRRRPPGGLQ